MKLIQGNTDKEILLFENNSIDLIIADIPWLGDKIGPIDYASIFNQFNRVLKNEGTVVVIVDTGANLVAFIEYTFKGILYFQVEEIAVFIEGGVSFGNLLIFKKKGHFLTRTIPKIVSVPKLCIIHPNERSRNLYSYIINYFSNKGDLILDPFMGTGNSGVMAKELERDFIGIEINPKYFQEAKTRING